MQISGILTGSTDRNGGLVVSPVAIWPPIVGIAFLTTGLVVARRELSASRGFDKLIALAGVLYAAPLAVFGTQHLIVAQFIMLMVPVWMPGRLFWAYFVGIALIAAALSIVLKKYAWLSASLLATMIFLFVLLIHLPNVAKEPGNRIFWTVAIRDTAFSAGALTLAAIQMREWNARRSDAFILITRFVIAITVLFFGIEHLLHPEFAPGVPLEKMTPAWVPFVRFWGYLVGVVLLFAGPAMLVRKFARISAISVGVVMILITAFLYLPILLMASQTPALVEGVNYVADTLMFGGVVLLLAAASPNDGPVLWTPSRVPSA